MNANNFAIELKRTVSNTVVLLGFITLVLVSSTRAVGAGMGEGGLDEADQLLTLLQKQKSIQAEFSQQVTDAAGKVVQTSTGKMKIQKPDYFLWRTDDPFEQLIVSNSEKLWIFDKDLDQLTIQPVGQQQGVTPAMLLTGQKEKIKQNFNIKKLYEQDEEIAFTVQPRGEENLFQILEIVLRGDVIRTFQFEDHMGQSSFIELSQVKLNEKIDAKEFEVKVSPQVDVIDHFQAKENQAAEMSVNAVEKRH